MVVESDAALGAGSLAKEVAKAPTAPAKVAKELLEDVFLDAKDGCWRYIVSMAYLTAESQARIRCQEKKK